MELENVKYDAFISYRHSPVDMFIAKSIHRRLENFKLPRSVIEKKLTTKTKITRVFRDQDELPLADNLSDPIDNALSNTDFLIVICTPRLPQSRWCLKEITTFLETHDREHILVVLAEGEPEESFPYELTHEKITKVDADGNTVVEEREIEPLAADVRGKNRHETEKLLNDATLRLSAAIFGLNYDDLKQRHKEQRNIRRIKIAVGVAAVSVAFAAVCLFLLSKIKIQNTQILEQNDRITAQNATISEQYDEIQEKYQSAMVSCASELFDKGRRKDSLYALINGVEENSITADTAYMLSKALYTYNVGQGYIADTVYENANGIKDLLISADGHYLAVVDDMGSFNIFDIDTDEKVVSVANAVDNINSDMVFVLTPDAVFYQGNDGVHRFGIVSNDDELLIEGITQIWGDGSGLGAFVMKGGTVYHYSQDGTNDYTIPLWNCLDEPSDSEKQFGYLEDVAFSPDKKTMVMYCYLGISDEPFVFAIDASSGVLRMGFESQDSIMNCVTTNNDMLYLAQRVPGEDRSVIYGMDINTASQIWYSFVDEDYVRELFFDDTNNRIIGNSSSAVFALDADTGKVLMEDSLGNESFLADTILKVLVSGGKIDVYTDDGSRYCVSDSTGRLMDVSFYTYVVGPPEGVKVIDLAGAHGNLFFATEHSNLVLKYSYTTLGEKVSDTSQEEYEEMTVKKGTDIKSKEYNVVNVICSEDGEYIFTLYVDGSIVITDKSGNVVNTIYNFEGQLTDVDKIDELGVYVLENYSYSFLLDKDMNIEARMRRFVKYEDNSIFITTGSELYKMPYISPEELLTKAKEELGDYECDESTKAKYGIR